MRSKSKKRRRLHKNHNYGTLEARNLLATLIEVNQATGDLTVQLTDNNDTAVIAIDGNDNVTVNGAQDLDTGRLGIQTLPASQITDLVIEGNVSRTGQSVVFNDNFTGNKTFASVNLSDVSQVTINGKAHVSGDFDANMTGSGGRFGDATTGQLVVGGRANINAAANTIGLNNPGHDFNELQLTTEGARQSAIVTDVNDLTLVRVDVTGNLEVTAGGDIEDARNTFIEVDRDARFTAASVTLGDNAGDSTNFFRSAFTTTGHVDVQEDSNTILVNTDVGSLTLRSVGGIYDGLRTTITVDGHAQLFGNNRVRIGEGGLDVFNAGSYEFRSNGHVHISENSDSVVRGDNQAATMNLKSWGHISDQAGTTIDVSHQSGFEGISVVLGDAAADTFNTGSMYFWTAELFQVTEDSNSHIVETKNRAGDLRLESAGIITDANDARVTVDRQASFTANAVNVGDTNEDWFNAGTVKFETSGLFKLSENSDLQLSGDNSAGRSVINSSGNISNNANTKVNVDGSAAFFADNIVIGTKSGDEFNAGTIAFRTATSANGLVEISEDSATTIGGVNRANTLRVTSTHSITDGPDSDVLVAGATELTSGNNGHIVIGDSGTLRDGTAFDAAFESRTLTVNTEGSGNALIEEDGDIILKGAIRANSLSLVSAADGRILDTPETQLDVRYNLNVEGAMVNLGTALLANGSSTDKLEFSTLTFKSTGNVNVSADDSFFLIGESSTGGFLTLESEGDIRTTSGSELVSQSGARFEGMDILVGNLADDCFDIIHTNSDGTKNLSVDGDGTENVQLGCNA
jgi:hypothetical protein